ncbi:calcium/sodium antiporter, partial [Dietzia sp. CW19]|uniref:calcium/sodium antiporter n=1 Tax=Dietzia sp. CW19 TaxID=1630634 RepID=UPI001F50D6F2
MSILTVAALAVGFVLLVAGGELLVRGASRLAGTLGISPLVVGLTVVAFATSTPELAVSVDAALSGYPGLAVGNVVGSNIANILLILGLTALIAPLVAKSRIVRVDIPIMVGFSIVLLLVALDGVISLLDGLLLLAGMVAYVVATVVISRRNGADPTDTAEVGSADERTGAGADTGGEHPVDEGAGVGVGTGGEHSADVGSSHSVLKSSALVALGVLMLVVGARLLVTAASDLAAAWGMSDLVIGLTVVAIGTSLPELATSLVAAYRGERDLAVGNIVGSNMFNIGAVLGITSLITPIEVAAGAIRFDLP